MQFVDYLNVFWGEFAEYVGEQVVENVGKGVRAVFQDEKIRVGF